MLHGKASKKIESCYSWHNRKNGRLAMSKPTKKPLILIDGSSYLQNATAGVAGPIFNFGKNKRRVEIYRQIAEESRLSYQKTCVVAVAEVEQSLQNVKTYKDEWTARNRQVIAARKNLDLSNARYYNGYISYLEVLDIERSLFDAELSLSELTQNQLSSMIQLYRALGGGWN